MSKELLAPQPTPICAIITTNTKLSALIKEDVLDHQLSALLPPVAEPEIDLCGSHLKAGALALSDYKIATIKKEAFEFLFSKATSMWNNTDNYATGLKIFFALNGTTIVPIFQPVYMKRTATGVQYTYQTSFGSQYVYDSSLTNFFKVAEKVDLDKIDAYQKVGGIQIKHYNETLYTNFRVGEDAEGVIFSFQTIFTLIHDNPTDTNVHIYNSIRTSGSTVKHCALLATKLKPFPYPVFENKYANRSHLCPPCATVEYSATGPTTCP